MKKTQLEKDIEFCIEDLGLNDNQIGEMLRCCEQLGNISCEYLSEEFVFLDEPEALEKLHDSSSVSYTHLTLPTKRIV